MRRPPRSHSQQLSLSKPLSVRMTRQRPRRGAPPTRKKAKLWAGGGAVRRLSLQKQRLGKALRSGRQQGREANALGSGGWTVEAAVAAAATEGLAGASLCSDSSLHSWCRLNCLHSSACCAQAASALHLQLPSQHKACLLARPPLPISQSLLSAAPPSVPRLNPVYPSGSLGLGSPAQQGLPGCLGLLRPLSATRCWPLCPDTQPATPFTPAFPTPRLALPAAGE